MQQNPEPYKRELNGGEIIQTNTTTTEEPQKPGDKQPKKLRYVSFRKKKSISSQIEPTLATHVQKPLRKLSFKSVALTIQKWLIRVSVPKVVGTEIQVETREECTKPNNVTVQSKPNWNSVFSGIQNHGNTCFLNAIIQCLSHTDLLAKYFVLGQYKDDLVCRKRGNSPKKAVGHGEVTERLAVLIKSLWTSRYSAEISSGFKKVVSKHGVQYRGTLQHDAQEFLLWLLDAVHEDVNLAENKKVGKTTSVQLAEKIIDYSAIQGYIANNQSFILDVFQALLRSTLTCPQCCKQSITFDPYLSLSLPIPQRTTCAVCITYIRSDFHKRHTRIAVSIAVKCSVLDLLHAVARLMDVALGTLVLTEIYTDGFRRTFSSNHMISDIHNAQNLFVFELFGFNHYEQPTLLMQSLFPKLPNVAILMVNCELQSNGRLKRFGAPYSVRVLKELNYYQLQEAIYNANRNIKHSKFLQPDGNVFGLRVCTVNSCCGNTSYLTPEVDHPLYQSIVEESLKSSDNGAGPAHVKMVAEWSREARERYLDFDPNEKLYDLHPSVGVVEKIYENPWSVTLDQCLKLYTREEQLNTDDAWLCSNCEELQHGAMKQLQLHTVPDVLIVHLKRFKQLRTGRSKLHLMVDFPVEGLDMAPYMELNKVFKGDPPIIAQSQCQDHIYDLYAVCNHLGSMSAGHYIAACKNPVDGNWYSYDDSQVARIPEKDIVTKSAYLLFYARRSSEQPTFLGLPGHWVFNVPKACLGSSQVSDNDQDNLTDMQEVDSVSPNLAEFYVSKKLQINDIPKQACHVMSESCV